MAWKRGSKSLRAPHVNLLPRRYSGSAKMKVLVSKPLPVFNKGHSSDHEGWAQNDGCLHRQKVFVTHFVFLMFPSLIPRLLTSHFVPSPSNIRRAYRTKLFL
jgi:hypothetical protein